MGRPSASLLVLALGAVAAMALASCGSGGNAKLLPGTTASEITENLDQVKQLAGENECIGAEVAAEKVSTQIEALGGVDKQLKQALLEGATRLNKVVESCEEEESSEETEAIETAEEPPASEKGEKPEKPEKSKPPKEAKEPPAETTTETTAPPPSGKGEGAEGGQGEAPPAEPGGGTGAPSGGVGPSAPAGRE